MINIKLIQSFFLHILILSIAEAQLQEGSGSGGDGRGGGGGGAGGGNTQVYSQSWTDCSVTEGITNPKFIFSNVYSDPVIVTKDSGQTVYKTITYKDEDEDDDTTITGVGKGTAQGGQEEGQGGGREANVQITTTAMEDTLTEIKADFTQYYHAFDKFWMPFLYAPNLNMCKEHPNFCPFSPGDTVILKTVHPPLNRFTPYGLYRSKQVYKDPATGEKLGCVDMQFLYCETDGGNSDGTSSDDSCSSSVVVLGRETNNSKKDGTSSSTSNLRASSSTSSS